MSKSTLSEKRQALAERHARQIKELEQECAILATLPDDLPQAPTIVLQGAALHARKRPGAWLAFSRSYRDEWTGIDVFASLERAGFKPLPATLCRWDRYRHVVEPGAQESIPLTVVGSVTAKELTDSQPIAPVWIDLNRHTGGSAWAFYAGPEGNVYKVKVPAPSRCHISARRVEERGGWHFDRSSARLHFPDSWHAVTINDVAIATVCTHSGAWCTLPDSLDGAIYFDAFFEQTNDPRIPTPAQFLAALEA